MRATPFFWWEAYDCAATARLEMVDRILRDRRFGREVPAAERARRPAHLAPFYAIDDHSMLERDPPVHTRLRSLVTRAFTSRRVEALAPEIRALARGLAEALTPGADLIPAFAEPLPVRVIARLLGVPEKRAPDLLAWSHAMVAMYQSRRDRAVEDAALAAVEAFQGYLGTLLQERRRSPRDDLLSALIAARDAEDRLSEAELVATVILLLNAGHEATVNAIAIGAKVMLESGRRGGSGLVEEILRFDPPLHVFERRAREDVEIDGQRFAASERIALVLGAAGRDPEAVRDPDVFDPNRAAAPHLAFGAGIHFCVGAPLARLELQIALETLFACHPTLALEEAPRFADRYHFRALERLQVTL